MKDDKGIDVAAKRATLLWLAGDRLRRAIDTKDEKHILKVAERLTESLRKGQTP